MPDIFVYGFMQRAFAAGTIIGLIAPMIGLYLIVRRYSLFADTLAHVSLLGVATAALTHSNPVFSALVFAVLGATGIEGLNAKRKFYGESILALFLSGSLALATILLGLAKGFNANFLSILFGSITTVQTADIYVISGLGLIVFVALLLFAKELTFVAYDQEAATIAGLPVRWLNLLLMILAAITVSLSIRIVGILLIGALMVIPGIAAMQWKQSFKRTMVIAMAFSLFSVLGGLTIAFYAGLASGGVIVLLTTFFFIASYLAKRELQVR